MVPTQALPGQPVRVEVEVAGVVGAGVKAGTRIYPAILLPRRLQRTQMLSPRMTAAAIAQMTIAPIGLLDQDAPAQVHKDQDDVEYFILVSCTHSHLPPAEPSFPCLRAKHSIFL
jgi:hypothetical protein